MNRKQVILLLVIGAVLGGIGIYLSNQRSASFASSGNTDATRLLGDFPVNDVAWITVRQRSNEVNLVKTAGWTVRERAGYPANSGDIIEFVRMLWDLRPTQSQKIGPSQLGRLELQAPNAAGTNAGMLIELKNKDGKHIRSLLFGKQSVRAGGGDPMEGGGFPNGRWIYLPDHPGIAHLISEPFNEIAATPERWLKKDFFHVEKARSLSVEYTEATNSWTLTRESENGEWKLADAKPGEQLDPAKLAALANPLSDPKFSDVLPGGKLEASGGEAPTGLKIETFDHFTYTFKIGAKTNDDHFLTVAVAAQLQKERTPAQDEKPEDKARLDTEFKDRLQKLEQKLKFEQGLEKWTWRVPGWPLDPLLRPRSEWLAGTTEAAPATHGLDLPGLTPLPSGTMPGGL